MARKLVVEIVGDASQLNRTFRGASHSANTFERDISKASRGALAGSGAFRSLGRSLAFASGGFLAGASFTALFRSFLEQGTQAAATQKQLAAQFRASGLNLADYREQIELATNRVSKLAGIEDDELRKAFTTAFRGSGNVTASLRIQAIAADVARGRHIELAAATLALTKAYGGQATALRRLGILVPSNLRGMQALEFVSRRFAGQAAAGATSQDKFRAALANTSEVIGLQLLPNFTKLLDTITKWLNNPKNQKKLQEDTKKTVGFFGDVVHVVGRVGGEFKKWGDAINDVGKKSRALNAQLERMIGLTGDFHPRFPGDPSRGGGGGDFTGGGTSEDVALRGATSRAGVLGPGSSSRGRLGFNARMARLQLALAKAELTASKNDDRAILQQEAALIRERLDRVKTLKARTALYQQLGTVETAIANIDKDAADRRVAHQQALLDAAKNQLSKLRTVEDSLKQRIQAIQSQFAAAVDTARQGIGELFAGPVLQPTDDARRRTLGLGKALSSDPRKLTADLKAQTRQFAAFQKDLNTLAKRGAPAELIRELRAQGLAAAPEAHALATAGKGTLSEFLKAFGKRERLAITTARTTMRAQLVTLHASRLELAKVRERERPLIIRIELDGKDITKSVTVRQQRQKKGTAAQRSGRNAGVNQ